MQPSAPPESVQEKLDAIHDLADDDQMAARVATYFLRRPAVAYPTKPPDRGGPNYPRHNCLTFPPLAVRFGVQRRSTERQP
ncbi:DUF6192 family protein [Streptomyces sp. SID4982]|uniref:DUF6192 family protein n=1 Tax=Streptomyces sp. SID4982 TaxID=2690291 RepID=UPI00137D5219|nr:DUF6192 family protein [Streptomyces sp. SID4982]MYS15954.1 hypothetical protein [Streptomyces sp. SID4982]